MTKPPSNKVRSASSSSSEKSVLTQTEVDKKANFDVSKPNIQPSHSESDCFEIIQNLDIFRYNNDSGYIVIFFYEFG